MAESTARVHRVLAGAAAAIVVIGVVSYRALGPAAGSRQSAAASTPTPSVDLQAWLPYATPLSDSVRVASIAVLPDPRSVHDPFAAPVVPVVASTQRAADDATPAAAPDDVWVVTATLVAGERRAAVINDKLVYVGDSLPGGATLTAVERDRVVVKDPRGASHSLSVKEGEN